MAIKLPGVRAGHRPLRDDSTGPQAGEPIAIATPGPQAFNARTGDIMVHDNVAGSQWEPVVASLTGGGYAVAWFSNTGTDKVMVRIFDNAGVAQTGEIVVATGRGGEITYPGEDIFDMRLSIAATDDGGMVLAWVDHDITLDSSGQGPIYSGETHVFAQRVAANGSLVGAQIEVAQAPPFTGGVVYMNPTVGAFPGGGFLVIYNDSDGLYGRTYGADNTAGFQALLSSDQDDYRGSQSIARLANGSLIAVWDAVYSSPGQQPQAVIEARIITPGDPGGIFTLSGSSPGTPSGVAVAALTGGGFVATWAANVQGQTDVYAQAYTAAGSPVGAVFRVNDYVPGFQSDPNVVGLPDGGFVISYGSLDSADPLSAGIYAQRFSAAGARLGSAFRVNDGIDGDQYQGYQEGVQVLSNGDIVFAWMGIGVSGGPANDTFNTFMRIFPGNELPAGPVSGDIPVADHGTADQYIPVIASLAGGGYAAAWFQEDGGQPDKLFVRLFDNAGVPRTAAIEVFSGELNFFNMDFFHMRVSIAATDDGGFVLAWVDHDVVYHPNEPVIFTGETHVYAQRFTAAGAPSGARVDVADAPVGSGSPLTMNPAVSALPGGGYLVIYEDRTTGDAELNGRIINAAGVGGTPFVLSDPVGGVYSVGEYSTATLADGRLAVAWTMENNSQGFADQLHVRFITASGPGTEFQVDIPGEEKINNPAIGALANGGFVVAWAGSVVGGSNEDVHAQIFSATGSPVGSVFRVNAYTPYGQDDPSIVGLPDGGFVISYQSPDGVDPYSNGIYAQRFSATGEMLGGAYRVNDATDSSQFQFVQEGVDVLSNGNLVFGWLTQGVSAGDPYDAYTRIFSGDYVPSGPIGGTTGSDVLVGTAGNDSIDALDGNDALFGGGGNDSLDGGTGADIADYSGLQTNYRVTFSNGVYTIVDLRAGSPEGTDTLRNIEQLRFNGGTPVNIQDAVAPEVGAGTPVGGEMLGNVTVTGTQRDPAVAALSGGGYVMLWVDPALDGSSNGIFARRFGADGAPIGGEFVIPSATANSQREPSVAGLPDGGFVATWSSSVGVDIYARRFSANGTPQGDEFRVNTIVANDQSSPAVAANTNGFVVTWYSFGANAADVIARLYNTDGTPATGEIVVNTTLAGNQILPSVAMLSGGGFVVTWEGADASGRGIFARQFTAAGAPVGPEFAVNNVPNGDQELPAVTALANGGFAIAWTDSGVHVRIFGADGQPLAAQFDVATAGDDVGLTALATGGFAVSWSASGTGIDVFGQIYDAAGEKVGGRFTINETLTGGQANGGAGALAQLADGTVAFAWSGNGTGDAEGVFARRFSVGGGSGPQPGNGTSGPDALVGTGGADTLNGLGGDDYLDGGAGADTTNGGPGNDTHVVDNAGDMVIEAAGEGNDTVYASTSYTLGAGASVETLAARDNSLTNAMNLIGNELANVIFGNNGANFLDGGAGADIMTGFSGDDVYAVDNAGDVVIEEAGRGSDTIYTSFSYVLGFGSSVETLAARDNSATSAMNLFGNELDNFLFGNNGANFLDGGTGADTMTGFGGNDIYAIDNMNDRVVEDPGGGNDAIYTTLSYNLAAGHSIEVLAARDNSLTAALNLTGNDLANTVMGNNGANVLNGGGGADVLVGFGGADTFAFTTAAAAGNADYIVDFLSGTDKLALDDVVFQGIGTAGSFNANAFVTGTAAADGDDRIIYNAANGQLLYDADGNGAGAAVLIATLGGNPAITVSDFQVI